MKKSQIYYKQLERKRRINYLQLSVTYNVKCAQYLKQYHEPELLNG